MERCIRFVVHQRVEGNPRTVGLFTAAYWLNDQGDMSRPDRERLHELLTWFAAELNVPPRGAIPERAVFWYLHAGPFAERMWELAQLLREYGFTTELVTARAVGRIVYADAHQVAAVPYRHRRR